MGSQTRRWPAIVAALLLLTLATPVAAVRLDDAAVLASLDAALASPNAAATIALGQLGKDVTDTQARGLLASASATALSVLDNADVRDCFRDWHDLARTAFWLLGRSIELIYAYDAAMLAADDAARSVVQSELEATIPPGVTLLGYAPVMRQRVQCGEGITTAPRPIDRLPAIS